METTQSIPGIAEINYTKDRILFMRMHKKSNIDLDAAFQITEIASKITGNEVHANLVDIRQMVFMSSEARKHFGNQNKSTVKAVAIIMNSLLHKPLINLYMKFSPPLLPTRIFNDENMAIEWLNEALQ